jgi:NADH-quinone oxidoreductase subunit B
MITTSKDKLSNCARKNSLWPLQFGLACCAIQVMSTGMAHNDLDRIGPAPSRPPHARLTS